jgi:AhpD family alkylhydroperoxidase
VLKKNDMEKELIALGASVAAGCQPCTEYHVRAARDAGACERGLYLAVETAIGVRQSATRAMDRWAERCQGSRPELDPEFRGKTRLARELVSIAAAVCVNSVGDLTIHLTAAGELGATEGQIRSAVAIARAIKRTAEEKLEAVIEGAARAGAAGTMDAERPACSCR